jgi:2-amino-4-hydroxy-6-hydroxymethyldihydropteridine diphosphokinase
MVETAVSLGSNLDDRLSALQRARDQIAAIPLTRLTAQSPVYETEPVGVKPEYQPLFFLNAVVIYETDLDLREWFEQLRAVERRLGRRREADRYAPRTIDIDLLYYGDASVNEGQLILPHPQWNRRRFVLQPLADVRPDHILPGDSRTVGAILRALPPGEAVKMLTPEW